MTPLPYRQRLEEFSDFGLRVRQRLAALGMSQADLADALSIRPQAITQSLRVLAPRLGTIERFAAALRCKPESLDKTYPIRKKRIA